MIPRLPEYLPGRAAPAFALGQRQVTHRNALLLGLRVHRTPLDWLRAKRAGIVIIRPELAKVALEQVPLLVAEDEEHRRELQDTLISTTPELRSGGVRLCAPQHGGGVTENVAILMPAEERPLPLVRASLPAAEFPTDALGDILGGAAGAIHEIVQSPLPICGQSVLAEPMRRRECQSIPLG